ncbi:hypothetical protein [Qipengyuania zhejiangensis]|uniref:hypothetical protein n=1 Tax=Qipengyuania zhejiangensis TaxID=3077782 RepID=UPI002D776CB2|nr:hypothetical protein [Qipengyuania sp. Z2]
MHIGRQLRALRGDRAAQRAAQIAMENTRESWLCRPDVGAMVAELGLYGAGASWRECARLREIASCHETASALVDPLIGQLCATLGIHPMGHVPFRHQLSGGTAILQLASVGRAVITLIAFDGAEQRQPASSITFCDDERHEIVLKGAADLTIGEILSETIDRGVIDYRSRRIVEGEAMEFSEREARLIARVHGRFVILRIARSARNSGPSRVFRLDDGGLVHRASGDRAESHRELAMALLGRMGRRDAAPAMAQLAREGSDHFRWQALRECLALDAHTGFAALDRTAQDPLDPLSVPAGALRAQLIEAYPQLSRTRVSRCQG